MTILPIVLLLPIPVQATPVIKDDSNTVIVTARRLEDTERDLKACLARNCPPKEDMTATLAHAENQFLVGQYNDARNTLAASRGRNERFAKTYPVEVADVTRAYARLTSLNGDPEWARVLTVGALDALKSGLAREDARVLMQRLENGSRYASVGRIIAADDVYKTVEKQARDAQLPAVQGYAMLRAAVLYGALSQQHDMYRGTAEKRIRQIEATTDPALAPFRDAATRLRIQLAGDRGDAAAVETALASLPPVRDRRPLLIYGPQMYGDRYSATGQQQAIRDVNTDDAGWLDVSYLITAAGKVDDVQILRSSPDIKGEWTKRALTALAGRRYAALALEKGDPGLYRVERFSFVRDTVMDSGSRVAVLSAGRVETLDLTPDEPKMAAR